VSGRVIVVGSINVDLVATVPRLPRPGETVTGGTFARHHGGKGGNQAVAAARLGAGTFLVAAIGADDDGVDARGALTDAGVDVSGLLTTADSATGVGLILVGPGGENLIAVASGANGRLDPPAVGAAMERLAAKAGDVVLVGHEIPTAAAREALRLARDMGATTILNPAPADGLDRSTFGLADVLTPNRPELTALVTAEWRRLARPGSAPSDPVAGARALVDRNAEGRGAVAVLVSLGRAGAILVAPAADPVEIAALPVEAVDTVGAGDALNGALAAMLAEGRDLDEAARWAVAAASLSTTREGARGGLPTREEVVRALPG
jgi:ribokinase